MFRKKVQDSYSLVPEKKEMDDDDDYYDDGDISPIVRKKASQ